MKKKWISLEFLFSEHVLLALFLICTLVISSHQLKTPMITEADAYARTNIARIENKYGVIVNLSPSAWLPLHFSLLHLSLFVYNDPFFSPRFLTLLFTVGSLFFLYKYTFSLTNSKISSTFATFFFFIFPLRFLLATHTFSEIPFLFFLLGAFYFLCKKQPRYFMFIVFINLAHAIRYGSWT